MHILAKKGFFRLMKRCFLILRESVPGFVSEARKVQDSLENDKFPNLGGANPLSLLFAAI
jgi:hypothetical protein